MDFNGTTVTSERMLLTFTRVVIWSKNVRRLIESSEWSLALCKKKSEHVCLCSSCECLVHQSKVTVCSLITLSIPDRQHLVKSELHHNHTQHVAGQKWQHFAAQPRDERGAPPRSKGKHAFWGASEKNDFSRILQININKTSKHPCCLTFKCKDLFLSKKYILPSCFLHFA